jgi:hypothetical protein
MRKVKSLALYENKHILLPYVFAYYAGWVKSGVEALRETQFLPSLKKRKMTYMMPHCR